MHKATASLGGSSKRLTLRTATCVGPSPTMRHGARRERKNKVKRYAIDGSPAVERSLEGPEGKRK